MRHALEVIHLSKKIKKTTLLSDIKLLLKEGEVFLIFLERWITSRAWRILYIDYRKGLYIYLIILTLMIYSREEPPLKN